MAPPERGHQSFDAALGAEARRACCKGREKEYLHVSRKMDKLILNSILAVLVVPPLVAAREASPRLALQKVLLWTVVGICVYELLVLFVYPRVVS